MLPTKISFVAFLVAITACLLSCSVEAHAFLTLRTSNPIQSRAFFSVRGGASVDVDDIESSDYDEEEEEEEDEDPKLAKSTQAAISKASKKAVSSTLASTKPAKTKKKSSSLLKLLKFPYIVGACLNPFVFTKMIKGYWVSLFNLEYLKENVVSIQVCFVNCL